MTEIEKEVTGPSISDSSNIHRCSGGIEGACASLSSHRTALNEISLTGDFLTRKLSERGGEEEGEPKNWGFWTRTPELEPAERRGPAINAEVGIVVAIGNAVSVALRVVPIR